MTPDTIAAQLYTIRNHIQDGPGFAASLRKLAAAGFRAIQISGMGADSPVPETEIVAVCRDLGITICATHEPAARIIDEPRRVIGRLQALGCPYTAYPHPHLPLDTEAQVRELAARLDAAGALFAAAGLGLGYHNHAVELRRFGNRTALDIIYDTTDPAHLIGEIDTYWIQRGGGDPVAWCRKLAHRMPIVHLKDMGVPAGEKDAAMCEVGSGNLDWPAIIAALRDGGCRWYIIEQDVCRDDPFTCLRRSRDYLIETFC
jgi:sugar phosphate isomerase/epimerase